MKEILKLDHIQKFYGNEGNVTKAIQDIDFSVQEGEFLGIMGGVRIRKNNDAELYFHYRYGKRRAYLSGWDRCNRN